MLQHEFEALIGRKATDEEYTRANGIYMNIDMTKEKFCEEWETVKDSKILKELRQCQADWKIISDHKTTVMNDAAEWIMDEIDRMGGINDQMEKILFLLADRKDITMYRLKKHYKLTKADTDYIIEHLK